jgi:hypothetical protein
MGKKIKKHEKKKHQHQRPQACCEGTPERPLPYPLLEGMPYPYDGLEREAKDLSPIQALHLVEGLLKPTNALVATLIELFHGASMSNSTVCFPQDTEEVLVLASTHLTEAERFCVRWRAAHTAEWP